MKRKLLLLFIGMLFSVSAFAQVTANPVADLSQCGNEIFDLTVTEAAALGTQSSATNSVTWHSSLADAENGTNPFADPAVYLGVDGEIIYLRVTSLVDDSFDTTSFALEITTGILDDFADITVCDAYTLPALSVGSYYTDASGQGIMIPANEVLTTTQLVYVYADNGTCVDQDSFMVTVFPTPIAPTVANVTACEGYDLPALPSPYEYYTSPGGAGTMLPAGSLITQTTTLYAYAMVGSCFAESSFVVTIIETQDLHLDDVNSCTPYTLPQLPVGQSYYFVPDGEEIEAGAIVYHSRTIFVVNSNGNCGSLNDFTVTIGDIAYDAQTMTVCGLTGIGTFAFTSIYADIAAINANAVAAIYATVADATTQSSQLLPTYTSTSASQTVYLRIDNPATGCFSIQPIVLRTLPCTDSSISGFVRVDADNNGCDALDNGLEGIQIACANGNNVGYAYTNAQGEFTFSDVWMGENVVFVVESSLPQGMSLTTTTPQIFNVTGNGQTFDAAFCIIDASNIIDAGLLFLAENGAVPGFQANYLIQIRNHGGQPLSGSVTLTYDETRLDFTSASTAPSSTSPGSLTIDFTNLGAFEMAYLSVTFTVATPPTANSGDILPFVATLNMSNDNNPGNNESTFQQVVVNSFDPNDITCHEGDMITLAQATQPLHYTIRFQNTGTAPAVNVRLENELSDLLDWNTFRPIGASHDYLANRMGNQVTFTFSNINLPAEQDDETGSNGYVIYEIKPKATAALGDVIDNTAEIYFDFNAAIVTNTASTTIAQLSTPQNQAAEFALYPNPTSGKFTIRCSQENAVSIEISDVRGSKVVAATLIPIQNEASVDVSHLQSGLYFVRINCGATSSVKKLMVK